VEQMLKHPVDNLLAYLKHYITKAVDRRVEPRNPEHVADSCDYRHRLPAVA